MDDYQFVNAISPSLICPICQCIFKQPIITYCDHSFCAKCIEQAISLDSNCPLCRRKLTLQDVHGNLALAGLIGESLVYCPNRPLGCQEHVRLDAIKSHASSCLFTLKPCPWASFGCDFTGAGDMSLHMQECSFEKMKVYLFANESRIQSLESLLKDALADLAELKSGKGKFKDSPYCSTPDLPILETTWPHGDIECRRTLTGNTAGVTSLAYTAGIIYSGSYDGTIKAFHSESGKLMASIQANKLSVWSLAFLESHQYLYSAGTDGTIKVWDMSNPNEPVKTCTSHAGKVYNLALSPDNSRILSASSDKTIKIWNPITFDCLGTLQGHSAGVNSIDFVHGHPNRVVSASNDKSIKMWDINTGQILHSIDHLPSEALDACSGNGLIFGSTYDANISLWNMNDFTRVGTLTGHKWEVWQLAYLDQDKRFSPASKSFQHSEKLPSGPILFSGSHDHMIKRWDLRNLSSDLDLKGHKGYIHALTLGNGTLMSGCADKTIKIWQ